MIRRKLRSERGASITFALLLFLVCAMVSSVVIVAATTASGRMSSLADVDRRYYAVSSAAELLGATLNGRSVKVVEEQTQTTTTTYGSGEAAPDIDKGTMTKTYYDRETEVTTNYSILTDAVGKLVAGDQLFEGEGDGDDLTLPSTETFPKKTTLSLTASGGDESIAGDLGLLSVNIYEELAQDGTLTFYVSKPLADDSTLGYTLRMLFEPERTEDIVSHTEHGSPVLTGTDGGYTITDVETITKTIVYKWTLIGVKKSIVPSGFPAVSG